MLLETIEDASLLMLYYISIGSTESVDSMIQLCRSQFTDFFEKANTVYANCKSFSLLKDKEDEKNEQLQFDRFLHLCVLRPSSLETCNSNLLGEAATRTSTGVHEAELMIEFHAIIMGHRYTPSFLRKPLFSPH